MDLELERVALVLRAPAVTSYGTVAERSLLRVRLRARDGLVGIGESAPLEPYDGVSLSDARAALEACRPVLARGDRRERDELLGACGAACGGPPQALAGIDLALWDLAGRRAGQPVWALLGAARSPGPIPVNATLGASDPAAAAGEAAAAVRAGFTCLKVKVGTGDDGGRLAAIRAAAGPGPAIRLDANGAWTVEEAVAALRALAPLGIELCEEPVHGVEALREVRRRCDVPVAMDETAIEPGAIGAGATDAVCLKIARCGGISGTLAAAAAARAAGSLVYLASTLDGPAGIAAALHVAAALGPLPPCGLATLGLFADVEDPFPVRAGAIMPPAGPGLGLPVLG